MQTDTRVRKREGAIGVEGSNGKNSGDSSSTAEILIGNAFTRWIVRRRPRLFLLVPIILILVAQPTIPGIVIGGVLVGIGLAIRIWASGFVDKSHSVACSGPYALVRHPLYTGTIFVMFGWCFVSSHLITSITVTVFTLLIFGVSMYWEERFMSKLFPDTYEKYMQGIPRLLPYRFKKSFKTQAKFSWEQVTINREQSSAFWMILATTLIAARWFIF